MALMKRVSSLLVGGTIAGIGISMVTMSGIGSFSVTCANLALANWLGVSYGVAGMLTDLAMLGVATKLGEGVGWTAVVNATYISFVIDMCMRFMPTNPWLVLGLLLVPIGWCMMGRAGLGDTASNILTNALLKTTGKKIGFIRGAQEVICMSLGLLGARHAVSLFTVALAFGLGYLLQFMYKLLKYEPTEIEHSFIIRGRRH